jgi:nicrotizing toxin Mtb-like protein
MAPCTRRLGYFRYEVVKPPPAYVGKIAPWFDQPGGGTQIWTGGKEIEELIDEGYLRKVKSP